MHGDELNGIEMVRRLMYELEPAELAGIVVGVPIVNLDGFRKLVLSQLSGPCSTYLPDLLTSDAANVCDLKSRLLEAWHHHRIKVRGCQFR